MQDKATISSDQVQVAASQWVHRLRTATGPPRQQAAEELRRLGVWTRGSVRTRGSLQISATPRLPVADTLHELVQALADTDKDVRCQVALALGEWGGEEAALALRQVLQADTDAEVQLHCIAALRTIGGVTAAEGLRWAAEHGTEAVRDAAITAIEELVTGGTGDDTEGPLPPPAVRRQQWAIRTRGAVRTPGGAQPAGGREVVDAIVDTLARLRTEQTASAYLRQRAGAVLDHLLRW